MINKERERDAKHKERQIQRRERDTPKEREKIL